MSNVVVNDVDEDHDKAVERKLAGLGSVVFNLMDRHHNHHISKVLFHHYGHSLTMHRVQDELAAVRGGDAGGLLERIDTNQNGTVTADDDLFNITGTFTCRRPPPSRFPRATAMWRDGALLLR